MAGKAKKEKNCDSYCRSGSPTNNKKKSKGRSNEKKEHRGKKRSCPSESQNDQTGLVKEKSNQLILNEMKTVNKNPVIHTMNRVLGLGSASAVSKFHKEVILHQLKGFEPFLVISPFDRRVTAVSWHPQYPKVFFAGSKGGDLLAHNLDCADDYFRPGVGAGGAILGLKCSANDPYTVYTAALTGKIVWHNFKEMKAKVLCTLPSSLDNWFTSLDRCENRKCLLAGSSKGCAYLISDSGKLIWKEKKLHKSKITHCEFNVHDPNLFVTSSTDHSVKLWDLRTVSNSEGKLVEPLAKFPHEKAVNAAYFSPSNGINILTTDQHSELRVYSNRMWDEVITITHPHRQFQHLTQMKAIWHPLEDIIIVGRYPDDNVQKDDKRTIDFYDGSNGQLLYQMMSPTKTIVSLNAVNSTGEILAAAAGFNIAFLKNELTLKRKSKSDEETGSTKLSKTQMKRNNKDKK